MYIFKAFVYNFVFVILHIQCLINSEYWINIWWRHIPVLSKGIYVCICKGLDKLMEASESVAKLSQDLAVKEKELAVASIKADEVSLHLFYHWWGIFFHIKMHCFKMVLKNKQGINLWTIPGKIVFTKTIRHFCLTYTSIYLNY